MRYVLDENQCQSVEVSTRREWLLSNGIGGYSMGTACGINARRYHGLLVAAVTPPTGRMLLLSAIDAFVETSGNPLGISSNQYPGAIYPDGIHYLRQFSVDEGAAVWRYRAAGAEIERAVLTHAGRNAVTVTYTNVGDARCTLMLRPLVCHRDHHGNFSEDPHYPEKIDFQPDATCIEQQGIPLIISHPGAGRTPVQGWYYRFEHAREIERGLNPRDDLYCPCELHYDLQPGESATLVASSDGTSTAEACSQASPSPEYRLSAMLKEAAEKFFVETQERSTIIAGYPWFTDWGRDTMISLPGLCLCTGRVKQARDILTAYSTQMFQGLIPNRFCRTGPTPGLQHRRRNALVRERDLQNPRGRMARAVRFIDGGRVGIDL